MKVRRFTASSMQKALKTVRDEMGPDAVILSNHRVKGGVEIIVAQNYEPVSARKSAPIYDAENSYDDSHLPSPKFSNFPDGYDKQDQTENKHTHAKNTQDSPWPFLSDGERQDVQEQLRLQSQLEELKQQREQENEQPESAQKKKRQPTINQTPVTAPLPGQITSKEELQSALENLKQQRENGSNVTHFNAPPPHQVNSHVQGSLPPAISKLNDAHKPLANMNEFSPQPTKQTQAAVQPTVEPKGVKPARQNKQLLDDVRSELNDLKELLQNGMLQSEALQPTNATASQSNTSENFTWKTLTPANALQAKLWNRFERMGCEDWLSFQLVRHLNGHENEKKSWQACLHDLVQHLSISPSDRLKRGGTYALVGPTGAGKTTTIAKMAVRYTIEHDDAKVGLITMDNYRLAAHDQLRTLGQILGVPVAVADHEHTLEHCLQDLHECDLILIDTAGLTPEHPMMKYQLDQLAKSKARINTLLTLPATSNSGVLRKVYHDYSGAQLSGCILTKTDEASTLGDALSVLLESPLGLSYVTDGQRIPDDIHVADAKDLIKQAVLLAKQDQHYSHHDLKQAAGAW